MKSKILLITYYWPPNGGGGVQRWLKMSKYLAKQGHEVFVLTPDVDFLSAKDDTLKKDISLDVKVEHLPIFEPYSILARFKQKGDHANVLNESAKKSFISVLLKFIREFLFFPDPRIYWVSPAVRKAKEIIKKEGVDVVVTTGPPHSMHLIGQKIRRSTGIKWIADFRDPWTKISYYKDLNLTKFSDRRMKKMEAAVLKEADVVTTVSDSLATDLSIVGKRLVDVVYNGYDIADLVSAASSGVDTATSKKFRLNYVGTMIKKQDVEPLWQALSELYSLNKINETNFELVICGQIDDFILKNIKEANFGKLVEYKGYQSHDYILKVIQESDLSLVCSILTEGSKGIIPAKMFESLALKTPVLFFGDQDGDAANILNAVNGGKVFSFTDTNKVDLCEYILSQKNKESASEVGDVSFYTRENQAKVFSGLLEHNK